VDIDVLASRMILGGRGHRDSGLTVTVNMYWVVFAADAKVMKQSL
jgi:hypothetical protein